jgi:hypothetical protein
MEKEKWYWKVLILIISVGMSVVLYVQNAHILRENDRINHRLDVRDAYFNKGLIDGAKEREKGYVEMRAWGERVLNHCRAMRDGCGLPNDLSILPASKQFDSLEALLTRDKEK